MSFAAGFAAGAGAANAGLRTYYDNKRYEEEKKFREEQQAWARKDRAEHDAKVQAYKDAGKTLTADGGTSIGEAGNRIFSTDPQTAAAFAEQNAAIAEMEGRAPAPSAAALAVGGKIYDDPEKAQRAVARGNTTQGRLTRLSEAAFKVGDADKGVQFEESSRRIQKEGYKDALDTLFRTGNAKQAQDFFDAQGDDRVDGEIVATRVERTMADGQKVPDFDLSIKRKDGTVERIGSALEMRMNADDPTKWTQFMRQGQGEARADAGITLQGRQVSNAERATTATIEDQSARRGLDERRLNADIANQKAMRALEGARVSIARAAESRAFADQVWRQNGGEALQKIQVSEQVLGRSLTPEERVGMLGLAKGGNSIDKFVDEIITQGVKDGGIALTGDNKVDIGKLRTELKDSIQRSQASLMAETALARVRAEGKLTPEALKEFKARSGVDDAWLRERGYIDAQGNAATTRPASSAPSPLGRGSPAPPTIEPTPAARAAQMPPMPAASTMLPGRGAAQAAANVAPIPMPASAVQPALSPAAQQLTAARDGLANQVRAAGQTPQAAQLAQQLTAVQSGLARQLQIDQLTEQLAFAQQTGNTGAMLAARQKLAELQGAR